jgi:PQQ-like domain
MTRIRRDRPCSSLLAIAAGGLTAALGLSACSTATSGTGSHTRGGSRATTSTSATSTTAAASSSDWTTYGGDFARSSADTTDPQRRNAPTEAWKSEALDGQVYGEPLVYHDAVYVGTQNDTVYAFSATTGAPLWTPDHLATPAPASALPCGDISPTAGIVSTMVIDPTSGVLFASAETSGNAGVGHLLFAIDSATGKVLWSKDVDQSWDASAQLQRAALAISNGDVLLGFGGNYGDCGDYNGWVIGVPETGNGALVRYRVPTAREGAVWAPGGISVDSSGDIYVATGNGSATDGQSFDHGNAVIELSPTLAELQYFAPRNWAQLNETDADLGSTAPVLLSDGQVFIVGKGGTGYLLNASRLGGVGGQLASLGACGSIGASAYMSSDLYVVCNDEGRIVQVAIGPGDSLHAGWTWSSPRGGASSPTIAGGVLWSIDLGASTMYGVNLATGATSYTVPLDVGQLEHFEAPSAALGMLFVAGPGGVEAFR